MSIGITAMCANVLSGYASPWGVMRSTLHYNTNTYSLLRIPMRGYECFFTSSMRSTCFVTHPHEGLWANFLVLIPVPILSYASPWGVMRIVIRSKFSLCSRYASPWGVMSTFSKSVPNTPVMLRIPMRGYELQLLNNCTYYITRLRIPMRGYETTEV